MTSPGPADMLDNQLLARLREQDRQQLAPHLATLEMKNGDILHEAGEEVAETWFPCGEALAAFRLRIDEDRDAVEVALVGREGAVGGIVSDGRVPAYATAQVRADGRFLRIGTGALERLKTQSPPLRHWFSRYSDCLLAQVFQAAACNATHTIAQRTAKWLLAAMARTRTREFRMTHEQLAAMLGVGRSFVTRTVRGLRDEGAIDTRRGVFIIRDEAALRARACGCSAMVERHFDAVLRGIYPSA